MSTSTKSLTIMTCDRCGYEQECSLGEDQRWANLNTQYRDGSSILPHGYKADLCPMCAGSLADWYKEKAA